MRIVVQYYIGYLCFIPMLLAGRLLQECVKRWTVENEDEYVVGCGKDDAEVDAAGCNG